MIFNERDRLAKIYIAAKQSARKSAVEKFDAMMDMNNAVLQICIDSIKSENPKISKDELLQELRKRYGVV